jgi:Tfp pilus assembly protein PilV
MRTTRSTTRLLRERLGLIRRQDAGLSIVEVLVAFLIFSIVSIGVAQALVVVVRTSADQRSRVVAQNLAATEIDRVRAIADPGSIPEGLRTWTQSVSGTTYTFSRTAKWVGAGGADLSCGIAEGASDFQLRRVHIEVTWNGKLSATAPVASDTLIAPAEQRDTAETGRILVAVKKSDGSPLEGVPVTITPTRDGGAVTAPPTDSEGCTYALNVVPGSYDVSIRRDGYLDNKQQAVPLQSVDLLAGGTGTAAFSYDQATTVRLTYPTSPSTAYPTTLDWTLFNSDGSYARTGRPAEIKVYPTNNSYSIVAGQLQQPGTSSLGCVSPDPASWNAATLLGIGLRAGQRQAPIPAVPGGTVSAAVPLGAAEVTIPNSGNSTRYLTAVNVDPAATDSAPGCALTQTIVYGGFARNSTQRIALPYGTWAIYASNTSGSTSSGNAVRLSGKPISNASVPLLASQTITIDPRARS